MSTINQASHKTQFNVRIANIELVISELTSKPAGDIRLQVASISAFVYQVRRPDANQPFEDFSAQRCPTAPNILELLAISRIANVGKTPKETLYIVPAQQFADRSHIDP